MDRIGADFYRTVRDDRGPPRGRARRHPAARSAPRATTSGVIDLVKMKALVWDETSKGEHCDVVDIPAELEAEAEEWRAKLLDVVASRGRRPDGEVPRRRGARSATRSRRAIRKGTLAFDVRAGPLRLGVQEQGRAADARRRRRLPAVAARHPAGRRASTSRATRCSSGRPTRTAPFAALAFKIVADPFGKLTYFRVYSGTIDKGDEVYNSTKDRKERLGRILLMHANQREDLDVAMAGDIVAGLGFKNTTTGDTLCDRGAPDRARADGVPRAGHPRRHRAEDEGRPGQAGQGALRRCPTRTRPSASAPTRRPARPSSPAWASCTSRCSSTACCASSTSTPPSASRRWPTARRSPSRSSTSSTATSSRPAAPASSPYVDDRPRAHRSRRRLRVRRQDHRRPHPARVHPGRRPGHPGGPRRRACSPATRPSTSGPRSSTASTTTSTRRRWRSRSPARWRSRRPPAMAKPVLLEPIMAVEVVTPEDYMGDVMGDLSSRRGRIEGMEAARQQPGRSGPRCRCRRCSATYRPPFAHPGPRHLHHAVRLVPAGARRRSPTRS